MKTRFQKICQSGCVCSLKYLELIFGNIKCNLIMKLLRLQNMKEKYRDFHFGEFIEKPNQCGYFERNGNWYTYVIDERNFCTFTGPFNGSAIIYACSKVLHISKLFKEYKFTEQELEIYINNSFHSFGEIDKKSERHFGCK